MATRANKGGEEGKNGEWYQGRQFLPSTTLPKQSSNARKPNTGKQEYEPYRWAIAPIEGQKAIYRLAFTYGIRQGDKVAPFRPAFDKLTEEQQAYFQDLMDRYNNGERWV